MINEKNKFLTASWLSGLLSAEIFISSGQWWVQIPHLTAENSHFLQLGPQEAALVMSEFIPMVTSCACVCFLQPNDTRLFEGLWHSPTQTLVGEAKILRSQGGCSRLGARLFRRQKAACCCGWQEFFSRSSDLWCPAGHGPRTITLFYFISTICHPLCLHKCASSWMTASCIAWFVPLRIRLQCNMTWTHWNGGAMHGAFDSMPRSVIMTMGRGRSTLMHFYSLCGEIS